MERISDDVPKILLKMNNIEHNARLQKLVARLLGLGLKGIMEPAHCLIDLAAQFVEEIALRHVNLHECISREEELQGSKKSKEWKTDGQGYVREVHSKYVIGVSSRCFDGPKELPSFASQRRGRGISGCKFDDL